MDKDAVILGLETSCDETAAAIVRNGRHVLSSTLVSQIELHNEFGGVVPEVAARRHVESVNQVISQTLDDANLLPSDLTGIACTAGPGLIGTLLVGLTAARSLSWAWDLPLLTVDHLFSHVCANYLETNVEPPFIALLVSGGHTQIMYFDRPESGRVLGQTVDDAVGEAFDKVGRLLGMPYPAGPVIDRLAPSGNVSAFPFPEGVVSGYDFSFSGLKTAVLRCVEKLSAPLPVADLAASFQEAVVKVLVKKTLLAQKEFSAPCIVLAGGVAANSYLRAQLRAKSPVPVYAPAQKYCTDNAAMVAAAGFFCAGKPNQCSEAYSRTRPKSKRLKSAIESAKD